MKIKISKPLLILLNAIFLISCQKIDKSSLKNQYLDHLEAVLSKEIGLKSKYSNFIESQMDSIQKIDLELVSQKKIKTVEKARELIVSTIDFVLDYTNNKQPLDSFWSKKIVFSPDDLIVSILFQSGFDRREAGFAGVNFIDGKIHYTWDYDAIPYPSETLEEANKKILDFQKTKANK